MVRFTGCHNVFILGASGEVGKELTKVVNLKKNTLQLILSIGEI